ncbi:unnamed protein product [Schistosoma margrebowiei]|uniref:Uncharacterized protein n=1 Tax=Schistosoma margrebowiei TaxID=48269 RepID=A0A183LE66_9TREM|nr:unnamed protein product [Schistosoma margrebowiei]
MKTYTSVRKHGMQRKARNELEDLNFVDDLTLLSYTREQMWMKTTNVAAASTVVNLDIHNGKTKILKYNTENTNSIKLDGEDLGTSTFLGSLVDKQGGSDAEINAKIGKARVAFLRLRNIWNLKQIQTNIKVRIINTNVKSVLLYGDEMRRTTTAIIKNVQLFINICLRKISNIC